MNSSALAAKRLRALLAADRADVSASSLDSLKAELLDSAREYFEVNDAESTLVLEKGAKRRRDIVLVCRIVIGRAKAE